MAEQNPPVWLQSGQYSALHDRLITGLLADRTVSRAGGFTGIHGGVVGPSNQLRVDAAAGFGFTITSGVAVIPQAGDVNRCYVVQNQGSKALSTTAAPASQTRTDSVVAAVYNTEISGTESKWELKVVQGAPSGSAPTAPSATEIVAALGTETYLTIANLTVSPAAITKVTDKRVHVAGPGGVHLHWGGGGIPLSPGRLYYDVAADKLYVGTVDAATQALAWDQLLTKQQWLSYIATYRTKQAYKLDAIEQNAFNQWGSLIEDSSTNTYMSERIQILDMMSPTGNFKITIGSLGKTGDNQVHGHISCEIKAPGGTVLRTPTTHQGPAYYNTTWQMAEATYIVYLGGDHKNQKLDFTVNFLKLPATGQTAEVFYQNTRLIVEPVL